MQHAKYIRLYADESGESHFEDLEIELNPVNFAPYHITASFRNQDFQSIEKLSINISINPQR